MRHDRGQHQRFADRGEAPVEPWGGSNYAKAKKSIAGDVTIVHSQEALRSESGRPLRTGRISGEIDFSPPTSQSLSNPTTPVIPHLPDPALHSSNLVKP